MGGGNSPVQQLNPERNDGLRVERQESGLSLDRLITPKRPEMIPPQELAFQTGIVVAGLAARRAAKSPEAEKQEQELRERQRREEAQNQKERDLLFAEAQRLNQVTAGSPQIDPNSLRGKPPDEIKALLRDAHMKFLKGQDQG